jgi:AraC-like DNA-binding protein
LFCPETTGRVLLSGLPTVRAMLDFYRKAIAIFLGLAVLTAFLAYICAELFFVSEALFPADKSAIHWRSVAVNDKQMGGSSSIAITDDIYGLDFEYHLTEDIKYPYVHAIVAFSEPGRARDPADLSGYSTATFRIKCSTRNILAFYLHSFDEKVTDPKDFLSYRIATALFTCHERWSDVEIDLKHLKVPRWWLDLMKVDVTDQSYRLDKVAAIGFVASRQGPLSAPTKVKITGLIFHGRNWRYVWVFGGFAAVIWIAFISWLFRQYTLSLVADVENKLKKDRALIAYQKLSIEPHRNKEKSQLLGFMATEYKNPDISLEYAAATLGINRTKINELLKDELGMTFGTYLNKLRLAEAARLLSRQESANVAEIARMVGYVNASYFNKLFKSEYGCTPGTFIGVYGSRKTE